LPRRGHRDPARHRFLLGRGGRAGPSAAGAHPREAALQGAERAPHRRAARAPRSEGVERLQPLSRTERGAQVETGLRPADPQQNGRRRRNPLGSARRHEAVWPECPRGTAPGGARDRTLGGRARGVRGIFRPSRHRRTPYSGAVVKIGIAVIVVLLAGCIPPAGGRAMGGPVSEPGVPRYINPGTLAALDGFTHAVKVGLTIYVSGEVALDSTGQLVGPGDLRAQARQAFANLAQVLRIAGAVPSDVTKLSIYVVNYRPGDFDLIREAG